jgi:plastocyanin
MFQVTRRTVLIFTLAGLWACGGSDGPTDGNNDTPTMSKGNPSGDAGSGAPGTALPALRVRILRGSTPVAGTTVTWAVTAGGGTVSPTSSQTAADGDATTTLTLPATAGTVTVPASASGVNGSPQTFTATSVAVGNTAAVQVQNNQFQPASASVKAGGTVTFTWATGAAGHNVTPVAPATIPASPGLPALLNAPQSFDQVFPAQGTFVYFCASHGSATAGMRGTITVVP